MKKAVLLFVFVVLLTGCGPKSPSVVMTGSYKPIQSTDLGSNYAELVICRPWNFVAGGVYSAFLVNDTPVAVFKSGCSSMFVKPGKHRITTKITDYDGKPWGKPFEVETSENKTTIVKFDVNATPDNRLTESPGFSYHGMTFYQPANQTIQTVYTSSEEKKKEAGEIAESSEYQKIVKGFIDAEDYVGLKAYVNENPRAAYYIPDFKMRLLYIGPKNLQVGDIMKYKKKNMSDVLLKAKIKSSKTPYKIFTMEEIEILQEYNVGDTLIAAMIEVTTEIEKEMARDEKQRELIAAQKNYMQKNQGQVAGSAGSTVAQELTKQVGKELIKSLLKSAF